MALRKKLNERYTCNFCHCIQFVLVFISFFFFSETSIKGTAVPIDKEKCSLYGGVHLII